ncbi:carbohydrate ABC transporter permease [Deinococcus sp. Arct2-2]|uniref:carbohydrate ABC transporter permease n=1 Tax=Deinococcus sp. Arct2-2 TaxID=2568653 RepID=UPI0010A497B2|nr:carbohydrate ABC transporter permease [Deinococcus sp. Arct2-2]THF66748.1 carbohydrate ABC transporter permease [Deinococcus sp. Arct2-2]
MTVVRRRPGLTVQTRARLSVLGHYVLMSAIAFVFLFPLVFMVMSSFKPREQVLLDLRSIRGLLPVGDLSLANYQAVFQATNFELYFRNSVLIAVISVVFSLLFNSLAAYALARLRWRGQRGVVALLIILLIIPGETIIIPLLLIVSRLPWIEVGPDGVQVVSTWINTLRVQIIPFLADVGGIFLFYQFFLDLPKELDEAAVIDGATPFQIYRRIIVPLSGPVFATVAILRFLGAWNAYVWPTMTVQSEEARPLMPAIQVFYGYVNEWGQIMAFATLITLPVLVLFIVFQRWFVASVASTGSKD